MSDSHRVLLITGAAGGIGRATVRHFASQGWRVIGVDRAEFGEAYDIPGVYIQADISDPAAIQTIFDQAKAYSNKLDAIVNNAAVQIAKPIPETSAEEWDLVMASNLRSVFLGAKLALRVRVIVIERGGLRAGGQGRHDDLGGFGRPTKRQQETG